MSSLSCSTAESADLGIKYKYYPADEKFLEQDHFNIVSYLFNNGLLNDIECRKIAISNNVVEIRAAIYEVIITKDSRKFKKILQAFRNRLHQFQNPGILQRVFSHLKYADLVNCKLVCPDWGQIVDFLFLSNYGKVKLEQHLLTNLLAKNETIKFKKHQCCPSNIADMEASVFQMMLAMDSAMDEVMLKSLNIRSDVQSDIRNSSIEILSIPESQSYSFIAKVLGNHTVLNTVFQFLSLASLKNCRKVCRTWHSVAEPFLRKLSAIKFNAHFLPIEFLKASKYLPLPDLHFKNFKFRLDCQLSKRKIGEKSPSEGLSEFLTQFGKNIRSLDVWDLIDMRSCLSHTLNLTELNVQGPTPSRNNYNDLVATYQMTKIPWNALHSIKVLYLKDTVIEVDKNNKEWKRITPLKLALNEVRFLVDGVYPTEITLNDYIDFTKITYVNVSILNGQIQQFDWARDMFYAEKMIFSKIRFANVEKSKSSVDCLQLFGDLLFSGKSRMSIKDLIFERGSLSLAALPPSLERLSVIGQNCSISTSNSEQIYLPNLKYLSYQVSRIGDFNFRSHFHSCHNLTDMEILIRTRMIFIDYLPRNIRRLKVYSHSGDLQFMDAATAECFDLDLLILDYIAVNRLYHLNFDKLRPKVLVIEVGGVYNDEAFVSFIRRNINTDKIYVQFRSPLQRFSKSQLSNIVDKDSLYYEFSNKRGKAITLQEFLTMQRSL